MTATLSPARKSWQLQPHDARRIDQFCRSLNVPAIVGQLLLNRNITDPEVARKFLAAPMSGLHEPETLPGIPEAVDRLFSAIEHNKKICVYGDYDVDGVTGTAILHTCLLMLGAQAEYHVPHRLEEGYGLNIETLRKLAAGGVQVVVTVDCGIASLAEADEARTLGVELIVTDHHEPKSTLPLADVIVHPRIGIGPAYAWGQLCGAGVAFKLAWALCKRKCGGAKVTAQFREFLMDSVTLAAMGTVADVVPLFDENRIFVRFGLTRMRQQPSLGLKSLLRCAKLETKSHFAAMDIGYSLAPRINAAGRLGTARLAVELLTTMNAQRADVLADYLERQNGERQLIERRILLEAKELAEGQLSAPALVLDSGSWHPGLLGIVASRLVDQFARPVLMITTHSGNVGQGSGRSVPGFKLHSALEECTAHLVSHGGHAIAAGFRIPPENIPRFRDQFHEVCSKHFGEKPAAQKLLLDAQIPLSTLTHGLMTSIAQLEPYGSGNPAPLLLADKLQIQGEPKTVGAGDRHLSFRVRQDGKTLRAIAFGMGDRREELMSQQGHCCLAFTPKLAEWQGFVSVEVEVRDFQAGPVATLE